MTVQEIGQKLSNRVPGFMGVEQSYAVLVPLVQRDESLHLLFEMRSSILDIQPGEVCFPGGCMENGESPEECALRETWEELGISSASIQILGRLDSFHHPAGFLLYPVLALVDEKAIATARLNPQEVDHIFEVPLSFFAANPPKIYHFDMPPQIGADFPYEDIGAVGGYAWRKCTMQVVVYPKFSGHVVWGLTGRVVAWLSQWLEEENSSPAPDKSFGTAGVLYLVPTPIGNLEDISGRMRKTLEAVDFIAAEDTRITLKLLNHMGLKKSLVSYYRHNEESSGSAIVRRILGGEDCALVTDAGTPAISDPGEELVALCAKSGIRVVPIPGPCALVAALSSSGLPTGRFTFEGFLAMNKKNRRAHLDSLSQEERTMIFYEAPHKLSSTLKDLKETFGPDRKISLCRELTKLYEEVRRTTLGEAIDFYETTPPRGEFVLVVGGGCPPAEDKVSLPHALKQVEKLYSEGSSVRDAVRAVAETCSLSRKELYAAAIKEFSKKQ